MNHFQKMDKKAQNEEPEVSIDAPIIQSHNDYLVNQTKTIKQRSVPWQVNFVN
jgi:hypothetical protein